MFWINFEKLQKQLEHEKNSKRELKDEVRRLRRRESLAVVESAQRDSQQGGELQELRASNIEENIPPRISKPVRLNIPPVHRKDLLSFIALLHLLIGQYLGF